MCFYNSDVITVVVSNYVQNLVLASRNEGIQVVQGPPGTGKTQTIINCIAQTIIQGGSILVSSTNNQAVQNIIEKLNKEQLSEVYPGWLGLANKKEVGENIFRA